VTPGYSPSTLSADVGVALVRQSVRARAQQLRSNSWSRSTSHDVTVESNPSRGRDRKIQY